MAVKQTRAMSLVLPLGLYNRIVELASKSRLNPHAYCIRTLWRTTKWNGISQEDKPLETDSGASGDDTK